MADDLRDLYYRDKRINAWLEGVKPGDIVTVRLNSTDILSGKVYEAPDDSNRTALYVNRTLLRYGNGLPGSSFEPMLEDSIIHYFSTIEGGGPICQGYWNENEWVRYDATAIGTICKSCQRLLKRKIV